MFKKKETVSYLKSAITEVAFTPLIRLLDRGIAYYPKGSLPNGILEQIKKGIDRRISR